MKINMRTAKFAKPPRMLTRTECLTRGGAEASRHVQCAPAGSNKTAAKIITVLIRAAGLARKLVIYDRFASLHTYGERS